MGIDQQLSPRAVATAAPTPHKQDSGSRRATRSHYLRQRQAMRAPLLPVSGMAMARGSETAYAMLQGATNPQSKTQRKTSRNLPPTDNLPPQAAALKRRIWASHPGSLFKFRFDKLRRVVVPPVEIPAPLSDPTLRSHMVSSKTIPVTRLMCQQQRDLLKTKRLPSRIREGVAY
ncbi:hypothetical protein PF008_g24961 [Phytophthora fragariae]|uniref:Uncharacterized protein n=1 Tax=Phytophthora fragariae TaxID=53985 RepID=A0A6G0QLC6_9STRA|nr:hypothetical protein PF008_g24961 [Phytophthora fragariae]